MDGVELEEYAYARLAHIEDIYVLGHALEATAISKRWATLGHPAAWTAWEEAAKRLREAADSIEQAIKEVKD